MELQQLITKLSKFYWSPCPPKDYVITRGNVSAGVGLIAHRCYGAFNVVYAIHGAALYSSNAAQVAATSAWAIIDKNKDLRIDGMTLEDALTLFSMDEFVVWYFQHRDKVPQSCQKILDQIPRGQHADIAC